MGRRSQRAWGAGLMEVGNQIRLSRKEDLEQRRQDNLRAIAEGKQALMSEANAEEAKQNQRMYEASVTENQQANAQRIRTETREARVEEAGIAHNLWEKGAEEKRIKAVKDENDRTFSTTMHNDFMSQAETFSEKRPDIQLTPLGAGILKTAAGSGWSAPEILEFLQDPGLQVSDAMEEKSPGMRAQVQQYRLLTDDEQATTVESIQALQHGIEQIWANTKGRDPSAPVFDLVGAMSMFPGLHKGFTMMPSLGDELDKELGTKYSWGGQD